MKQHITAFGKTPAALLAATILTAAGTSMTAAAPLRTEVTEGDAVELNFVCSHLNFNLIELYLSGLAIALPGSPAAGGVGTELWRAKYSDTDGWYTGVNSSLAPDFLAGGVIDFGWRTGDFKGDFTTTPAAGGEVFAGKADIDSDIWEIGFNFPFACGLYGRVGYYNREDDVDWRYDDGDLEKQEYETERWEIGVGAMQTFPVGDDGLLLVLNEFVGAVYHDVEHKEVDGGLTTDWSDWGYVLRAGAELQYPLNQTLNIVGGVAYEYVELDDSGIDREDYELMLTLGLSGSY